MFRIYDGREEFYQWDLNRKLIVDDSSITQVHFCNKTDDCSLVVEVYELDGIYVANVPNILLQSNWNIKVYGYDREYTKHCAIFKVNARTKPSDYAYTETEILNWTKVNERVDEVEDVAYDALMEVENLDNFTLGLYKYVDNISSQAMRLDYDMQEIVKPKLEELEDKTNSINNDFSNALKGEKKDTIVAITDISPVEHNMSMTVSGVEDLAAVKLYVQGSNLFNKDISKIKKVSYILSDGKEEFRYGWELDLPIGTYTIKPYQISTYDGQPYLYGCVVDENNTRKQVVNVVKDKTVSTITFTISEGDKFKIFDGYTSNAAHANKLFSVYDVQINAGTTAIPYEPYKEPIIYDVLVDGTVEGVKPIYPNTTLYTDTDGALVSIEYNRDINKAFAELQQAIISMGGNI